MQKYMVLRNKKKFKINSNKTMIFFLDIDNPAKIKQCIHNLKTNLHKLNYLNYFNNHFPT